MSDARCPVCGTPGRIISADEGTSHFEAEPSDLVSYEVWFKRDARTQHSGRLYTKGDAPLVIVNVDEEGLAEPSGAAREAIFREHRQCGTPYQGCYSHVPMDHCRACGMAVPCDVMQLAVMVRDGERIRESNPAQYRPALDETPRPADRPGRDDGIACCGHDKVAHYTGCQACDRYGKAHDYD